MTNGPTLSRPSQSGADFGAKNFRYGLGAAWICHDLIEAAVMSTPRGCVGAHPAGRVDDFVMHLLQPDVINRFVVHHTISEAANDVKAAMDFLSWLRGIRKSSIQALTPKGRVVMRGQ